MEIGKTLYFRNRVAWRSWLAKHHRTAKEIWLIYYKKHSGKPAIPYNHAVEEALCYGWIDSIVKSLDKDRYAQRFSPRKKGSVLSEMNRERIRRLVARKRMTAAGLKAVDHVFPLSLLNSKLMVAPDIMKALKRDKIIWKNFRSFPASYKRIRIGWIESARVRPDVFRTRLKYFLAMTAKRKRFGMIRR
ncbi:MAG: YdeI/OmpD-associated family protein [Ignavibacteriales bacterium]|nr:YdeI/OmpD-associated family protein [Ignavibacteriales bacterium]